MPSYRVRFVNPDRGLDVEVTCRDDQPLLEAAEARGLALPYSCRSAACATCACKILEGEASLEEQFILGDADLEAGFTLSCSAVPRSDMKILTHQQGNVEGM